MPDEEIFKENSSYLCNRPILKLRFIAATGVEEKCVLCGQGTVWLDLPLVLQLDHINGVNTDHRLENLRLLCPNCHTQTDTYGGRVKLAVRNCEYTECGQPFQPTRNRTKKPARFCSHICANRDTARKRSLRSQSAA